MNHTPGPWRVGPWGEHTPHEIKSFDILIEDVNEDADIAHVQKRYTKKQTEANARLIAAAPEMLAELIEFCRGNCDTCTMQPCHETCGLKQAKELIERTTGRKIEEVI